MHVIPESLNLSSVSNLMLILDVGGRFVDSDIRGDIDIVFSGLQNINVFLL